MADSKALLCEGCDRAADRLHTYRVLSKNPTKLFDKIELCAECVAEVEAEARERKAKRSRQRPNVTVRSGKDHPDYKPGYHERKGK